jgi:hypothetical protein
MHKCVLRQFFCFGVVLLFATPLSGCMAGGFYLWSYDRAASPVATSAYIRAVMAAESGDDAMALYYYDIALSREDSEKVRAEREEVRRRLSVR